MRGTAGPGVFLLGASGRTGRFFTQLLFHNPHSTTIRQIHLVWQWTKNKNKNKNRRILTISTNRTSCISQNRSMVFPTGVNWFTCNIFPLSFTCSFHLSRFKENLLLFIQSKFSHCRILAHFSYRVDFWNM